MAEAKGSETPCYLSIFTLGDLRTVIEIIRHRGDEMQPDAMTMWYNDITEDYADFIRPIDQDIAPMHLLKANISYLF